MRKFTQMPHGIQVQPGERLRLRGWSFFARFWAKDESHVIVLRLVKPLDEKTAGQELAAHELLSRIDHVVLTIALRYYGLALHEVSFFKAEVQLLSRLAVFKVRLTVVKI